MSEFSANFVMPLTAATPPKRKPTCIGLGRMRWGTVAAPLPAVASLALAQETGGTINGHRKASTDRRDGSSYV